MWREWCGHGYRHEGLGEVCADDRHVQVYKWVVRERKIEARGCCGIDNAVIKTPTRGVANNLIE